MRRVGSQEARNTFPLLEVIFDPSLVLSPRVTLLGLILADNAFLAPNLTSAKKIGQLDIQPGYEQLPLHLKPEMPNILIFRKSIRTLCGWKISRDQQLPYSTFLPWMKKLGVFTAFPQFTPVRSPIVRETHSIRAVRLLHPLLHLPLTARHANCRRIGDVSDALQNIMLQHVKIDTFIKHYLLRRVTADTRGIVSGYEPQRDLMRAAYRITR
jgi:hypothetical protein